MPGKVLTICEGKPLLQWTIDRLRGVKCNPNIVVATSNEISDDVVYRYCNSNNIDCYRGSLNNVIQRMIEACSFYKSLSFIRICGDSPLIDPMILDQAIKISNEDNYDLVTNTAKRTFPKGQSVELINLSALKKLNTEELTESEQEHVTKGFYRRKEKFNIINFESNAGDYSKMQLSVDTYQDFRKIENLIKLEKQSKKIDYFNWKDFSNLAENFYA